MKTSESMQFKSEYYCNVEWASNPTSVVITLDKKWEKKIADAATALATLGANTIQFWWQAGYEFYDDEGEVFTLEYRIGGGHLKVYASGDFQVTFPLKDSNEEGWTDSFVWESGENDDDSN